MVGSYLRHYGEGGDDDGDGGGGDDSSGGGWVMVVFLEMMSMGDCSQ